MSPKTLTFILTFLLLGCASSEPAISTEQGPLPARYVIFTAEQMRQMGPIFSGDVDGVWTPSEADVAALEAQLPGYLASEFPQLAENDLDDYVRQYWGETTAEGTAVVHASFLCDIEMAPDWQQSLPLIDDGGDCFFDTEFDPATASFLWLTVHGES